MSVKRKLLVLAALLLAGLMVLSGCESKNTEVAGNVISMVEEASAPTEAPTEAPVEAPSGPIIKPQEIANYIFVHGKLPDNFITKAEAQALGWDSSRNYLSDVAPGKSIGGDRFSNYEKQLPKVKGRKYFECDCNYVRGKRGAERIVYSSDGHVWYTDDHYATFTELFPSKVSDRWSGP